MECAFSIFMGDQVRSPFSMKELALVGLTAAGAIGVHALQKRYFQKGWLEGTREISASMLTRVPAIKRRLDAEVATNYLKFCAEWEKKYSQFGEAFTQIPDEGWSMQHVNQLLQKYVAITNAGLQGNHFSGTLYLHTEPEAHYTLLEEVMTSSSCEDLDTRIKNLPGIFNRAQAKSILWNPLHSDEFAVGPFINKQVVKMVAEMFGGHLEEIKGVVTSGGTESLMTAAKSYRNWGKKTKGIEATQAVIIAPDTIHAALWKARDDYEIKLVLVPTNEEGQVDLDQLERLMSDHQDNLVAVFASTPSYALGVVDPIEEMAALAQKYGCGMHVDACLGGFVINNLYQNTKYLALEGVTSISCDTHKSGLAPKGSSVLVGRPLGDYNIIFHGIYGMPNWECVYATATTAGSASVPGLCALMAMLHIGKNGYVEIANKIHETAKNLASEIRLCFAAHIEVICPPSVNVLAIRMKQGCLRQGAIYGLINCLKKHGFVLNALRGQRAHLCLTQRFINDPDAQGKFLEALKASLAEVMEINEGTNPFPGEGAIYGTLAEVYQPNIWNGDIVKSIENLIFGPTTAETIVKKWVEASL